MNRFILIAFLPIVALAVYLEGQSYDPALIRFAPSDTAANAGAAFFPPEIESFSLTGRVRVFTKDNLYEYVNGHAEYFLSAGFVGLAVGEYIRAGADSPEPDVVVDIFDMGEPIQAFGVFADEAGEGSSIAGKGMVGAKTSQGLSFVGGKYYVKIAAFSDEVPVDEFAARINGMLGTAREENKAFSRLPDLGETVATRFVKEAYRGLDFANNVIEREYRLKGKRVQVSLVAGDDAGMKRLLEAYFGFFKESGTDYSRIEKDGQEFYRVMDPYEGDWYMVPLSDAVFGIYGVSDEETLNRFLASIMKPDAVGGE